MAIYAVGDIQGCFTAFQALLKQIQFQPNTDILWFTGDLVNRGPHSLEVLRFVKRLGNQHVIVLGNHDLHLLALAYQVGHAHQSDTLTAVLMAPDCDELIHWLCQQPLLHVDQEIGYIMVHAGLAPVWSLTQAQSLAKEVESALRGPTPADFLRHMYGNQPDQWHDQLQGMERLRCISNYFTRMRLCHPDGHLDLRYKGSLANKPADLLPWFKVPHRATIKEKIIFGHWAALNAKADVPYIYP